MARKLRCVKEYRCAEFTARPGDVFTVGGTGQYSMTEAKAEQVLRDFPHCWEKIEDAGKTEGKSKKKARAE